MNLKRLAWLLLAASSIAASAGPAAAQPNFDLNSAQREAMPYLAIAGASDVFEISSSQIALMRSQNPGLRSFATMLIDHHSRTTNLTLAAAKTGHVMPPPPVLSPDQMAMISALYAAPAAEFDRVFLDQQLPAHQSALSLQQGYAANGDTAPLRATAKGAIPIIEGHLAKVQEMRGGM